MHSRKLLMSSILVLMFHLDCLPLWCLCWLSMLGLAFRKSLQLILGCVVGPSVASLCGEQPQLVAPRYKLAFRLGSVMSAPLSETFSVIFIFAFSQNPLFLLHLCRNYWLQHAIFQPLLNYKHCLSLFTFRGIFQHTRLDNVGFY